MKFNFIALAQLAFVVATGVQGEQVSGSSCGDKADCRNAASSPDRELTREVKASTKVIKVQKHTKKSEAQVPTAGECSSELFQGAWMYVGGICQNLFGVVIHCEEATEGDGTCDYTERVIEYHNGDDPSMACDVGGTFSRMGRNKITYDSCTGDCTLEYFDLSYDPCELYTPTVLGLKAVINVKNDEDEMDIYFSNDGGGFFYNEEKPRQADRIMFDGDEPARRGRHRRALSKMDKNETVTSSGACNRPTNFFAMDLLPKDYHSRVFDPQTPVPKDPSRAFERTNIFTYDHLDLASCKSDETCKLSKWIVGAGTEIGKLPAVITKWQDIYKNGWPDDKKDIGDIFSGVGDFVDIFSTVFPPLALAGGVLNTIGAVLGTSTPEDMELLTNITATLEVVEGKIDVISENLNKGINAILDKLADAEFRACFNTVQDYALEGMKDFRGSFRKMIDIASFPKSPFYDIYRKDYSDKCFSGVHVNTLIALKDTIHDPSGCLLTVCKPYFLKRPEIYAQTVGAWATSVALEIFQYEAQCEGFRAESVKEPNNPLFEGYFNGLLDELRVKDYCRDTPGETTDLPNCSANQYCSVKDTSGQLKRRCVDRFESSQDDVCKGDNGQPRNNMCTSGYCHKHTWDERVKDGLKTTCTGWLFWKRCLIQETYKYNKKERFECKAKEATGRRLSVALESYM